MRGARVAAWALAGIAASAGLGCGEAAPVPGTLTVSLVTPSGTDGGILVTVRGPGVAGLAATSSALSVFWRAVSPDEVRVAVVGNLAPGPVFQFTVPDVGMLAAYSGSVIQAAGLDDAQRASTSGYGLTFAVAQAARR